ncbi:MAG: hypothetical protein U0Q55_10260 [Vicinamibacterales bacterium]
MPTVLHSKQQMQSLLAVLLLGLGFANAFAQQSPTPPLSTPPPAQVGSSARPSPQSQPANQLERLLQQAFTAKNPKVTRAKVLELRSIGMAAGPYILLGWGIRADENFVGNFEDELFGVFVLDNNLTRIERVLEIFPTCRWADCIVSIESVSWDGTQVVVAGHGSYGDGPFRKHYSVKTFR